MPVTTTTTPAMGPRAFAASVVGILAGAYIVFSIWETAPVLGVIWLLSAALAWLFWALQKRTTTTLIVAGSLTGLAAFFLLGLPGILRGNYYGPGILQHLIWGLEVPETPPPAAVPSGPAEVETLTTAPAAWVMPVLITLAVLAAIWLFWKAGGPLKLIAVLATVGLGFGACGLTASWVSGALSNEDFREMVVSSLEKVNPIHTEFRTGKEGVLRGTVWYNGRTAYPVRAHIAPGERIALKIESEATLQECIYKRRILVGVQDVPVWRGWWEAHWPQHRFPFSLERLRAQQVAVTFLAREEIELLGQKELPLGAIVLDGRPLAAFESNGVQREMVWRNATGEDMIPVVIANAPTPSWSETPTIGCNRSSVGVAFQIY